MSYYDDLVRSDVVEWMKPLVEHKIYKIRRADGKFEMPPGAEPLDSPWHHIRATDADCPYLHQQLFLVISPRTPVGQFVPSRCQACWKVVVKPRSLRELLALESLMLRLDLPSKCGIERRDYTPKPEGAKAHYGGYFYCTSKEEGLDRYRTVRELVNKWEGLGEDVDVKLKRACTEMELAIGPSDEWTVTDDQLEIERVLNWVLSRDLEVSGTAKHMLNSIHRKWIEWAYQHGDETYKLYTDGNPIYKPSVEYHEEKEEESMTRTGIEQEEGAS